MKTLAKLFIFAALIALSFAFGAVIEYQMTSTPDYRQQATIALSRMAMSSATIRELVPGADPRSVEGQLVSATAANIDESLAHLEHIHPSLLDIEAWKIHLHLLAQLHGCRKMFDKINADRTMSVTQLVLIGVRCDPLIDHNASVQPGGGPPPKQQKQHQ